MPRHSRRFTSEFTCRLQSQLLMMLLVCCCSYPACAAQVLKDQALESSVKLKSAFFTGSRIEELTKAYEEARDGRLFTVEQADPATEVEQLSDQIGQMVAKKTQAVKEAVAMAEEVAAGYKYNPNIQKTDVHYVYCSKLNDDDSVLEYDRRFLQKIARNHSAVHIPTNTYNGRSDILNQLSWTQQMEQKMLDTVANEEYFQDTVRYMYLVTDMGLLRLFPGMKWRSLEGVTSMYDARRTSWFIEGSTCTKDMLLLIDTSGSMHGQNLLLTKQAAKSLIGTLGENDYVAVGQYPGKAKNVEATDSPHLLHDKEPVGRSTNATTSCFHSFVQATKRHKERLFNQIDSISAKGIVDLTEALEFAFRMFADHSMRQNSSAENHGAKCSSIVALFTDGDISNDMEKVNGLIKSYRKQSDYLDKVRIFVYSVGVHRNPDEPLENLACSNRGSFTDVPAMGAVTSEVQEGYLTTLRNVGALYEAKLPIESRSGPTMLLHSHFDPKRHKTFLFFSENQIKDLGLGVLTSLTMPIYNTSGNNSFLGLIGTDIAIKDWVALVPKHRLGSNGYAFVVNSNGYVVFHPELKTKDDWYMEPANLDLLEIELDDEARRRVRNLIVGSLSQRGAVANESAPLVTIEAFKKVSDGVHVHKMKLGYAYKRIDGTPYAASVVLPTNGSRYAAFSPDARPTFEKAEGFRWTVTLGDNGSDTGAGSATVSSKHPSPWAAYLVPAGTPFCKEYYRPPPPPQQLWTPPGENATAGETGNDTAAAASDATADVTWRERPRPGGGARPTQAPVDEHQETEQTERLRLIPETLANLLQTLALNSSVCSPHWSAAVALDLALLNSHFAGFARSPPGPGGPPVRAVAASGLSGVTGVFPSGEAVGRYSGWREGWSAGHYQRAVHLPHLLFASVPLLLPEVYNNTEISATPMTTMASPSLGVVTANASSGRSEATEAARKLPEMPDLTFYKAATLRDGFSVGVSGVTLSGRWVADTVFVSAFASLCDPSRVNNTCYLVEDGGYIVSTNQEIDTIGHFLGTVDKPLMRHLVFNLSVFASQQEFDHQGICIKGLSTPSSKLARALQPQPLGRLLLPAAASLTLMQRPGRLANLMMLPLMLPLMEAWGAVTQENCIKMGYRYYRPRLSESRAEDAQTSTDELGRQVSLAPLEGTNLMLVAVSWSPGRGHPDLGREHRTGAADYDELRRELKEDDGPDVCVQDFRYRVRPETCYKYHPKEEKECKPASAISASGFVIIASVCAVAAAVRRTFG